MSIPKRTEPGLIYFMRRADGVGPIKIGCSSVPLRRLAAHQIWSPEALEILASVPGTFADEFRLHRQFASHRLHGEWFEAAPTVLAAVARAASTGQLPPPRADDRYVRIMARFEAGETYEAIGADFGVTRQRIEQIVRKSGGAKRGVGGRKRAAFWGKVEQVRSMASKGCPRDEIAAAIETSRANLLRLCKAEGIHIRRRVRTARPEVVARAYRIAADYKAGAPIAELVLKHGCDAVQVYRDLRLAGVKPNRLRKAA